MKHITVVGAVIEQDGRIFACQRGPGMSLAGMWEFPGGKIEPGESGPDALAREITEELECTVRVGELVTTTEHQYDFGVVSLTTYVCALLDGTPRLTEHSEGRWLPVSELHSVEWAPADIPAVEILIERLG